MMAVDTSALVAIALDEPTVQASHDALRSEKQLLMSAGTMAKAMIVAGQNGFADALQALIERFGIDTVPVTQAAARRVAAAQMRWGRGAHPAGSILVTVSPTRSHSATRVRCFSLETTLAKQMCRRL